MFKFFKKKISLEKQLADIKRAGIELCEGITIETILEKYSDRDKFEDDPYRLLLVCMGGEIMNEDKEFIYISKDIWHLDTECIYDTGDYVKIAERFRELAKCDLPIENVNDYIDLYDNKAWISFSLDAKEFHWDIQVDDDWIDTNIISEFTKLLTLRNTERRYTYLDLKGQDCLIGCCTSTQFNRLKKITGLNFEWLIY